MRNSLAQLTLKMMSPGVPDIYQGNELWDLHLVDPDNRQPVDFKLRGRLLKEVLALEGMSGEALERSIASLMENWHDGRIKLYVTRKLLALRASFPSLFANGDYRPLEVEGSGADRLCAFQRIDGGDSVIVAVGRFFAEEAANGRCWSGGGSLKLPEGGTFPLEDVLTGRRWDRAAAGLSASDLFQLLPMAVLKPVG
jgi:(1->4)-alpha-D-glucan 1-alpha-D-glucosylmutase